MSSRAPPEFLSCSRAGPSGDTSRALGCPCSPSHSDCVVASLQSRVNLMSECFRLPKLLWTFPTQPYFQFCKIGLPSVITTQTSHFLFSSLVFLFREYSLKALILSTRTHFRLGTLHFHLVFNPVSYVKGRNVHEKLSQARRHYVHV